MQTLGKVLLVDDDAISNFMSARALSRANAAAQVYEAENGYRALELVRRKAPDLILLDVNMPGMNGIEFLRALQRLQETKGFKAPVVVLLTTSECYLDSDSATQCPLVKGALTKPLTQDHVRFLTSLAMDAKQARR